MQKKRDRIKHTRARVCGFVCMQFTYLVETVSLVTVVAFLFRNNVQQPLAAHGVFFFLKDGNNFFLVMSFSYLDAFLRKEG